MDGCRRARAIVAELRDIAEPFAFLDNADVALHWCAIRSILNPASNFCFDVAEPLICRIGFGCRRDDLRTRSDLWREFRIGMRKVIHDSERESLPFLATIDLTGLKSLDSFDPFLLGDIADMIASAKVSGIRVHSNPDSLEVVTLREVFNSVHP